ncbi:MAG: hypothetical protein E7605_09570 [Ruminococcaceae bacterium]|nr:hypothetical protein [Oscillospiraceae bacterium]
MIVDDTTRMPPDELNSRPSLLHLDTVPVMGQNFDVLLLRADAVVSAPCGKEALGQRVLAVSQDDLTRSDAEFLAVALPECDRVALVVPWPASTMGEAVVLLPDIGMHSMMRVLRYAFVDQVKLCGEMQTYGNEHVRAADEHTYQYLQALLSRCRILLSGVSPIAISDRKQLSRQLIVIFHKMEAFFGLELNDAGAREFPVAFAYEGTLRPTSALWMLMCLTFGIMRGCTKRMRESMRLAPDEEMLLPMLEIAAGNKTRLPVEWAECRRMAEREGMFFDVRRKRNSIRIRFCPMTPHTLPQEFYSVKAMAPIIEGIKEMTLKSVR